MPRYRHTGTGNEGTYTPDFVALFPEGTYEEVGESAEERARREVAEAMENKVDIEPLDPPVAAPPAEDRASVTADPTPTATERRGSDSTRKVRKDVTE